MGLRITPHTRGKHGCASSSGRVVRITPAHAGKTSAWATRPGRYRDHPRTRGENIVNPPKNPPNTGSPPHTRGKHELWKTHIQPLRITPAHAGKTRSSLILSPWAEDHPRTRGENQVRLPVTMYPPGSPPHTRGKLISGLKKTFTTRITPAHAGKTKNIFHGIEVF